MSRFSVTTPASDVSLLTIPELRAAAGVSDASKDAELTIIGRRISTAIARQCALVDDGVNPPTLLRETCTEIFRWTGCGPLPLSRRPVTSVTSVTVDGSLIDAADYEIAGGSNLYRLSSDDLSYWALGKITVVYVAGYSTAPDDLKLAASKLVTSIYSETARDPSLKREDIPGVIEREYWVAPSDDPLLSKEISDLLAPYKQHWI
jgi:hypothetical protein